MDRATAYENRWRTLGVLCLSLVIVMVGNSSLNIALPSLAAPVAASRTPPPSSPGTAPSQAVRFEANAGQFDPEARFVARTGLPFTVFDCTPTAITVCLRLIPTGPVNFGKPDQLRDSGGANSFIYTDLSNQALSTFTDISGGNEVGPFPSAMTRRNSFRGPGFWNADLALFKNIRFTERMRLQLRAEAFNVFNHSNLYIVGSSADRGNGFVQAKKGFPASNVPAERRNLQMAVRFMF
mgnify:CR=1 FL=1